MKKKHLVSLAILGVFVALLMLIVPITFCTGAVDCSLKRQQTDDYLDKLKTEANAPAAGVLYDQIVILDDRRLDVEELLEKGGVSYSALDIMCVSNSKLYCVAEKVGESDKYIWSIVCIDVNNNRTSVLYEGEFGDSELFVNYENCRNDLYLNDLKQPTGGYYHDEKIVLFDTEKVVEYNTNTNSISEYPRKEYSLIGAKYTLTRNDGTSVALSNIETGKRININLHEMSLTSDSAKRLLELSDRKIWDSSTSPIDDSISEVYIVNGKIYIIASVLNWYGESYAVVFEYDEITQQYSYLFYCFVGDIVSSHFSIIDKK